MNTKDLAEVVRNIDPDLTVPRAAAIVDAIFAAMLMALQRGEEVRINRFAVLDPKYVAARKAFNPATREAIIIPEHRKVVFRAAKALREGMNSAPKVGGGHKPQARERARA